MAGSAEGSDRKVRYAVVGLGHIARTAVLPAFARARRNSKLTALVSGDAQKREALAREYGVGRTFSYEEYDDCLRSGEIDAVYIALPNSLHQEYSVRAANTGVHVLCEKPMAVTEAECRDMIRAAEGGNVRLMTAYRLHFDKANAAAREIADSGRLGRPRIFQSVFTMQVREESDIRLRRATGGGTLYDIGVYCINAARNLFHAEPEEVSAFTSRSEDPRFSEIEEMVSACLRFPGDRLATFSCSFGASDAGSYEVVGTEGSLRLDPAYGYSTEMALSTTIGSRSTRRTFPKRDQFASELLHFSECVRKNLDCAPGGREGLADVRVIRAIYESARNRRPVVLAEFDREDVSGSAPAASRRGIREPEVVHASSPGGDD